MKINRLSILIGIACILAAGLFRIYYGGGIGIKVMAKHSFSFSDTVVNLDNIIGQPRIVVATNHPAVKRQLEEIGAIESDEQLRRRTEKELSAKVNEEMRKFEEIMEGAKLKSGY